MGSDALSKLTKAGETAWKSFQQKWYDLRGQNTRSRARAADSNMLKAGEKERPA